VSGPPSQRIEIAAPAKLNLGLEVIGKRDDGFHEIATIYLAVSLADSLTLEPIPSPQLTLTSADPALATPDNLVLLSLEALREDSGHPGGAHVHLVKRIPVAGGLGGASSDAAAALLAARELWRLDVDEARLARIAARVGSDVPFFLHGGCALGRGRGEILESLPMPERIWFVLVTPTIEIPHKTARLYGLLTPEDFSDGARIAAQADRLRARLPIEPALLTNAFTRPLYALVPALAQFPALLRAAGATTVALSGAGPTHFAPVADPEEAERIAADLRLRLGAAARVAVVGAVPPRR
jgi:4-diphosphocytidyl-2-C-methyl-D-erythritol kinase